MRILADVWRKNFNRHIPDPEIKIVCATRMTEGLFWTESPMGQSIKKLLAVTNRISADISFANKESLPTIYNRGIDGAKSNIVLVFVHDDVWLDEKKFTDSVHAGLKRFEVIGVAGNTRRLTRQTAWPFKPNENGQFEWDWGNLSGAVWHSNKGQAPVLSKYGELPAKCELLDGVFIAVRAKVLKRRKVRFDEKFDFHFYDLDFCRTARAAGLILGTWGIPLIHESGGSFGSEAWSKNRAVYLNKWTE
jgi:GT2 family glycosyltransferase